MERSGQVVLWFRLGAKGQKMLVDEMEGCCSDHQNDRFKMLQAKKKRYFSWTEEEKKLGISSIFFTRYAERKIHVVEAHKETRLRVSFVFEE